MSEKERKILKDIMAFIQFCIDNDMTFGYVLGNVGHDVMGLFEEKGSFSPRTSGYSDRK